MDTQELVEALADLNSNEMMGQMYDAIMGLIGPALPADEASRLREKWFKHVDRFKDLARQQYETMFDHKELQAIWAWTTSSAGKKLRELAPQISAEGAKLGQEVAQEIIMEIATEDGKEDVAAEFIAGMKGTGAGGPPLSTELLDEISGGDTSLGAELLDEICPGDPKENPKSA